MTKATLNQYLRIGEMIQSGALDRDLAQALIEKRVVIADQAAYRGHLPGTTKKTGEQEGGDSSFPYDIMSGYLELELDLNKYREESRKNGVDVLTDFPGEEADERCRIWDIDEMDMMLHGATVIGVLMLGSSLVEMMTHSVPDAYRDPSTLELGALASQHGLLIKRLTVLVPAPTVPHAVSEEQGHVRLTLCEGRLAYESVTRGFADRADCWRFYVKRS